MTFILRIVSSNKVFFHGSNWRNQISHLFCRNSRLEGLINVRINLPSHLWRKVIGLGVVFKRELRPNTQMHYLLVYAVGPVIVEDFNII